MMSRKFLKILKEYKKIEKPNTNIIVETNFKIGQIINNLQLIKL